VENLEKMGLYEGAAQSREASHGPDECIDYGPSCRVCAEQGEKRALTTTQARLVREALRRMEDSLPGLRNAERDLSTRFSPIWAERASLEIADRIIDKVTDRFWLLGEHPDEGRLRMALPRGEMLSRRKIPDLLPPPPGTDILHVFCGARISGKPQEARETR